MARTGWLYLRLELGPAQRVEDTLLALAPELAGVSAVGEPAFWFLRKRDPAPHIRLRVLCPLPDCEAVAARVTRAARAVGCPRVARLVYEPEQALFGGPEGMEWAHRFFMLDTAFLLGLWQDGGWLPVESVSLWLWRRILRGAGLDAFEEWDVWSQLTRFRMAPEGDLEALWEVNRESLERLNRTNLEALPAPVGPHLAAYKARYVTWARGLADRYRAGALTRGLRQLMVPHILFHWNRADVVREKQQTFAYLLQRLTDPIPERKGECHATVR